MKKLLLASVFVVPTLACAADLPAKPIHKAAAPVVTAPSPFYVFIHGGVGFTDTKSDITINGTAFGTPKLWPAGAMIGGGVGYLSSIGPVSVGVEAEGNYDFTRSSAGCLADVCTGVAKNSWFFAEKALAGITISQILGYVPGSAQPANWPVPITVPADFNQNMMLLGVIGAAQRSVDLCVLDQCANQWKNGLLLGGQARFAVSPSVSVRVEYDYIMFNQAFVLGNPAVFSVATAAKDQQRAMAGFNISF